MGRIKPPSSQDSLDPIAATIHKQAQVTVEQVHLEPRFNDPAETIEALAEINRLAAEVDLRAVTLGLPHGTKIYVCTLFLELTGSPRWQLVC